MQRRVSHTSSAAHVANATGDQLTTTGSAVPQFVRSSQAQQMMQSTSPLAVYTINSDHTTAYGQTITNAAGETVTTYQPPTQYTISADPRPVVQPDDGMIYKTMGTTQHGGEQVILATSHTQPTQTQTSSKMHAQAQYGELSRYVAPAALPQIAEQTRTVIGQARPLATGATQLPAGHQAVQPAVTSYSNAPDHAQEQVSSSGGAAAKIVSRITASQHGAGATRESVSGSRTIGYETGQHRLLSVTERVDESRSTVLSQNVVSREIRVPKRILREEVLEKVIIVPEKKIVEEFVDEIQTVKETIIEVAKPTIVEKVIEVPEIEIIERIIEVPEKLVEERFVTVDKIVEETRVVGEPEIVYVDKYVDVPVVEERWRDVEKVVEVPDWYDEIVTKEVRVPQYREVPVPRHRDVSVPVDIHRDLPVPVEAEVTYEYRMPQLKPRYAKVAYPVYLPRFIEIPVAAELLSPELTAQAHSYLNQVSLLIREAASLCEIEGLAANVMKTDFQKHVSSADLQSAVLQAWKSGQIALKETRTGTETQSSSFKGASTYAPGEKVLPPGGIYSTVSQQPTNVFTTTAQ